MSPHGIGRRRLLGLLPAAVAGGFGIAAGVPRPANAQRDGVGPTEALERLIEGNRCFVAGQLSRPNQTPERRRAVASGQFPYAIVLGCSDSRVPPEIIFDAGLGDIFSVRVAGNVIDSAGLGSIEFAVAEFEAPLIVVLGHSQCGAVKAAIDVVKTGAVIGGPIGGLVDRIVPAVRRVLDQPGDLLANAVRANVENGIAEILASEPILATRERIGSLDITGAVYDLASGVAELVEA